MKKIICLTIVLCLVLGSFSFSFAAVSDSQAQTIVSNLSTIITHLSNISSRLNTIQGYLYDSGHSIAYWVSAIDSWMQPIYGSLTDILSSSLNMETVAGLLGSVNTSGSTVIRTPYLFYNGKSNANWLSDIYNSLNGNRNYSNLLFNSPGANGTVTSQRIDMSSWSMQDRILTYLLQLSNGTMSIYSLEYAQRVNGYNNLQSLVSFADPNSTVTFTPLSATDGLYKYLNAINTPLARLGYVLASDSRIEAQQAAAANEQEVVDSFIDSNGSGAASTSDFSDMAGLSSGYSSNFNTGQSASGLFTVFGSDKWTYLSQETMDSFDTTGNRNRRSKSNTEYDTPYLDRYYEEVLSLMGLEND